MRFDARVVVPRAGRQAPNNIHTVVGQNLAIVRRRIADRIVVSARAQQEEFRGVFRRELHFLGLHLAGVHG